MNGRRELDDLGLSTRSILVPLFHETSRCFNFRLCRESRRGKDSEHDRGGPAAIIARSVAPDSGFKPALPNGPKHMAAFLLVGVHFRSSSTPYMASNYDHDNEIASNAAAF